MRNRLSEDFGYVYDNSNPGPYPTPGSPMYDNKKAHTEVKADIQEMVSAGYPINSVDWRHNKYKIANNGTLTKSYTEGVIDNRSGHPY